MAKRTYISTVGLRELQERMKRMEVAIEPRDVTPILIAAVNLIRDQALINLRGLGIKVKTGNLEKSLITRASKSSTVASAWTKAGDKNRAPHAHLIEYGHRIVGRKPDKKDTGKMVTARPFFRPAVDAMRKRVRDMISDGIVKLLWESAK